MERRTLNILVLNWQDRSNPLAGGAEVHLHEIFERIAAMGHRVTLFCHAFSGASREEEKNGIRIIRAGGRNFFNYIVPWFYFKRFRKERYDVIIDDINKIPFFTPLFVREPVLAVTHHLFGKSIFLETAFPFALYVYLFERLIKPVYKRVLFVIGSPSTQKEYIAWGFPESQIHVINYCVNKQTYYPPESERFEPDRIAYFGRLKKYKSVHHLLAALQRLLPSHPNLMLDIIGDGDDRGRLENIVREMNLNRSVTFHGFVREEDKTPLLHKANFVVNTSSKEGWGLTVIEANACGAPVIAADVQGLRDSVKDGETGLLYPYGDVDALSEKMDFLLTNPDMRKTLAMNALEWAAGFDWDIAAEKTLQRIYDVVDRAKR